MASIRTEKRLPLAPVSLPYRPPAHKALHSCVRLSQGRLPDPTWKRRPGRPRGRWIDQLRRDNIRPPAINGSWLLNAVTVEEQRYGLTTKRLPDLT